jgi:hypothetical protein
LALALLSQSGFAQQASQSIVKKLLQATGSAQLGMQFMHQMRPHLKQLAPDAPEELWENLMAQVNPEEMENLIIPVYQKYLTEEGVQAIIAFYSTPAGIKLVQSQPLVMQESMIIGQQWGQDIALRALQMYRGL